jgi:hypothetical protein
MLRRRVLTRLSLEPGLEFSILRFVHYAVLALALLFALEALHVNLTGLAVVAGVLSVGVGFGLQNLASNFISGMILLIERPITVGDQVTVGDVDGHVRAINIRATEIVTDDNISIIVPNSEFISGRVVNWSHGDPKLRLRLPVGVSYRSDVDHVGSPRRCGPVFRRARGPGTRRGLRPLRAIVARSRAARLDRRPVSARRDHDRAALRDPLGVPRRGHRDSIPSVRVALPPGERRNPGRLRPRTPAGSARDRGPAKASARF